MNKSGLRQLFLQILLLCLVAIPALASDNTIYVIKKGDTLWGLSERFLNDPMYWPDLWSKNRDITNPHLIYPGQRVRFVDGKLEIMQKEDAAPKASAPEVLKQPAEEVAEERTFTVYGNEGGLFEEEIQASGIIVGGQHGRELIGEEDTVFTNIGSNKQATEGEQYTILRSTEEVYHPFTEEKLGRRVLPLGVLQLTRVAADGSRAIITKSYREIARGDMLIPHQDFERKEISLKASEQELSGYIVESYTGNNALAAGDVIYLDLGTEHGAEEGNLLYIVRDVSIKKSFKESKTVAEYLFQENRYPLDVIGAVVIIKTGRRTSTALIVKSIDSVFKNEQVLSTPH